MLEPEVLLTHRDFVRAIAAALIDDVNAIDDVEQQTWLAASGAPPSDAGVRGWLAGCARNLARQFHRGEKRRREREHVAAARESVPSVAEVAQREEERRRVVAAVLSLAEPYRSALLLRFFDELPPREVAKRLAVPVETVRTRVKRGLELVRARLVADRGGDRRGMLAALLPLARHSAPRVATAMPVVAAVALLLVGIGGVTWHLVDRSDASKRRALVETAKTETIPEVQAEPPIAPARTEASRPLDLSGVVSQGSNESVARITGRVVDARRAPIGGAQVYSWPDQLQEPVLVLPIESHVSSATVQSFRRPVAQTDSAGRFEVAVGDDRSRRTLFVSDDVHSPGTQLSVGVGDDVTIVLEDDDVLVGLVSEENGDPISGATVHAWGMHGGALIEHSTTTNASGEYRLPYPVADRAAWQGDSESWVWWVEVRRDGFAPRVVPLDRNLEPETSPLERRFDVVLGRGETVRGRVVDAENREPIAGARVVLVAFEQWWSTDRGRVGGSLSNPYGERALGETTSDDDGQFVFEHVPAHATITSSSAPASTAENRIERRSADVPEFVQAFAVAPGRAVALCDVKVGGQSERVDVTIEMRRGATIEGRVVDAAGRPVAGVQVEANVGRRSVVTSPSCVHDASSARVRTDGDGHYTINGVPVGSSGDEVANVTAHEWNLWESKESVHVAVRAAGVADAPDLVVVPVQSVVLEVVDEFGVPVGDARVTLTPHQPNVRFTDRAGRLRWFERAYMLARQDHSFEAMHKTLRFRVEHTGFATAVTATVKPTVEEPPLLHVVLERGHAIRGRVVDPLDQDVAHAPVFVLRADATEDDVERARKYDPSLDPTVVLASLVTKEDGSFATDELPDVRVKVVVYPPLAWQRAPKRASNTIVLDDVRVDGPPLNLRLESQ